MWLEQIQKGYVDFRKPPSEMILISLGERGKRFPLKLALVTFSSQLIELSESKDFVEKVRGRINKF